ncbi:MAG: DNA polymerase/3'-5' exonuclease PolX [Candidatus Micrarchaeia archaeon]
MRNLEIAAIFYAMADILEIQNVQWKPQAYRKAARSLENLSKDVGDIYAEKGMEGILSIPGVGEGLAKKIVEYIQTGKIKEYDKLRAGLPKGLAELIEIPGMGPKRAMILFNKLGIRDIAGLKQAAQQHKIAALKGFGEKSEANILQGIALREKGQERMLLGTALQIANDVIMRLKNVKGVDRIEPAGSLRRRKETIGDIDILVTTENDAATRRVMDVFTTMPDVVQVLAKGRTKSAVLLKGGIQTDVRVLKDEEFGSALQYFTGSKEHNIELRKIAIKKGLKLSEYGLFKGNRRIAGKDEEGIYKALGMEYIPPEMRENTGEIEAAINGTLPEIVDYGDIKGDLHVHTDYSDGDNTIEEMVEEGLRLGYEYVCISDHSKGERIANGMDEERLLKQLDEIKKLNSDRRFRNIRILTGCEVDIKINGELDFSDDILKKLDVVICSIHSGFKSPKEKMTERMLTAMDNRYMKILGHPTGRVINQRLPYELDIEKIFEKAANRKIAMEINSYGKRLDLNDSDIRKAKEYGIKFSIGTDAHNSETMRKIHLGVAMARRGWAEKKEVLNTYSLKELMKFFGKR